MKSIRSGRGLGDSLYLQAIVRHLTAKNGQPMRVMSDFPEIFWPLGGKVNVVPFTRAGVQIIAHYSVRKGIAGTTQFQDCCHSAGITEPVELRLDWQPMDPSIINRLKEHGRPIVLVQMPRAPMGRTDGFGADLLPDCAILQAVIDAIKDRALIVQIGMGVPLFRFRGIDVDLANRTNVAQLLDVASCADGFLGFPSFVIPLAESFEKPALICWSSRGLRSGQIFIRRITPEKLVHRRDLVTWVVDDWGMHSILRSTNEFLR